MSDNVATLLPKLVLNELFVRDLMAASPPCFAMGLVEQLGNTTGFLAMRPSYNIPRSVTDDGFRFGHSLFGNKANPFLHFAFEFYGHSIHNALIDPTNPIVRTVIQTMIKTQDYFFFAITPDQKAIAFRKDIADNNFLNLKKHFQGLTDLPPYPNNQYDKICSAFAKSPDYEGVLLNWVCRDNPKYLNMQDYRFDLNPA